MTSPAKLFSCVDSQSIFKSPLNKSSAKSQYSFSKTQRFITPKAYCDNIYDLPNMKSMRKTTFGYGKNIDLEYGKHRHNKTPLPDHYKINSFVQNNKEHIKGSSCHIGRDKTTPRSYIQLDRIKFPGPGRYEEFKIKDTPKWTMRKITEKDLFQRAKQKIVPGPEVYNFTPQLNPQGKYYASKYKNSDAKIWSPPTLQRFYKSSTDVPGSGNYNPKFNDLSDSGKYTLSKYKGQGKRKFTKQFRDSFVNKPNKQTKTPGPGKYRQSSDFGQYDQIKHIGGQSYLT